MLFADEPTGTLDPETARLVHQMLSTAAQSTIWALLLPRHFSQVIEDVADRAILLVDGTSPRSVAPKEVIDEFMLGYDDSETFEHADSWGKSRICTRSDQAIYIGGPRASSRQLTVSILMCTPRKFLALSGKAGRGKQRFRGLLPASLSQQAGRSISG